MIHVVMVDLSKTLVDARNRPFPDAAGALTAIAGQNRRTCLVSNFPMDLSPAQAMSLCLAILDEAGLRGFFEPVRKRVTLSNHAGAAMPDGEIFRKALQRLGSYSVPFSDCLLISHNASHVHAVRGNLHMKALQFGADFASWAEAPSTIARLEASADMWISISVPGHEDLEDIHVHVLDTSPDQVEEARSYVRSLADNQRIAGRPGKTAVRATHAIETDARGRRRLVRMGFSAL